MVVTTSRQGDNSTPVFVNPEADTDGRDSHGRHDRPNPHWSREAEELLGYSRLEAVGQSIEIIIPGLAGSKVECNRCKTRASLPLDAIRRPRDTPIWKLEAALKCRSCRKGRLRAAGAHDQADRDARDHAVSLGASG